MFHEITWPDGIGSDYEAFLKLEEDLRYTKNRHTYYLTNDAQGRSAEITAIVCVAINNILAEDEADLFSFSELETENTYAHLYTIWSYAPRAGRNLALKTVEHIKETYRNVNRILTLSPKTDLARKFHLSNGAIQLKTNETTVNFEYRI
jgi:hypothetical protein